MGKVFKTILINLWIILIPILTFTTIRMQNEYPNIGVANFLPSFLLAENAFGLMLILVLLSIFIIPIYYLIISVKSYFFIKKQNESPKLFVIGTIILFILYWIVFIIAFRFR